MRLFNLFLLSILLNACSYTCGSDLPEQKDAVVEADKLAADAIGIIYIDQNGNFKGTIIIGGTKKILETWQKSTTGWSINNLVLIKSEKLPPDGEQFYIKQYKPSAVLQGR